MSADEKLALMKDELRTFHLYMDDGSQKMQMRVQHDVEMVMLFLLSKSSFFI